MKRKRVLYLLVRYSTFHVSIRLGEWSHRPSTAFFDDVAGLDVQAVPFHFVVCKKVEKFHHPFGER